MIHTLKMFLPIDYRDVQDMRKRFNIKAFEVNKFFEGKFPGVTMSLSAMGKGQWKLSMFVDAVKLLGKPNLTEADYPNLERQIKMILFQLFMHSDAYDDHILQRIDYRFDVFINNQTIRQLLLDLYKKTVRAYKRKGKVLGYKDKSTGEYIEYKTTVDHKNKSIKSTVYLKNEERKAKGEKPESYEKDIVRFEVQVKEDHTYYQEKIGRRPRKLWEYMKDELYQEYFDEHVFPIFHKGNFYKIDEARKIIYASSISSPFKRKLIDFLKKVSSHDVTTPLKTMTKKTLDSRLAMLQELGINPIPIPKNYPNAPSSLENPLNSFPM
jgi:predicted transcriptional regulator